MRFGQFRLWIIAALLVAGLLLISHSLAGEKVRESVLAGAWYPDNSLQLAKVVDGFLDDPSDVRPKAKNPLRALIVPHAGYMYSGPTAAKAFRLVRGMDFTRVLLLAPSHYSAFKGLSIADVAAYQTPLGTVSLDQVAVQQLRRSPLVSAHTEAHKREHSIEIELPLLQRVLEPGWKLVPVLVGQMDDETYPQAAKLLRELADEQTLVVVSSDFAHYGKRFGYTPFPLNDETPANIQQLDGDAIERIVEGDARGFLDYQQRTGITICGFRPIALLLHMLPVSAELEQLVYETSGQLTGNYENSVSYVVIAVSVQTAIADSQGSDGRLSREQLKILHRIAVAGVRRAVLDDKHEGEQWLRNLPPELARPSGAFVTLKKDGMLRGCIGYIRPRDPLFQAVLKNGGNAAVRDRRFPPVTPEELEGLEIEVSVLTPPRPIAHYEAFKVGQQGIILTKQGRSAVFLPEVAVEQGWNREQTLTYLARKAGLPADAWKDGAEFEVFYSEKYAAPYGSSHETTKE